MVLEWFNFDYFSVIKLSSLILSVVAAGYLFSLKNKTGSTVFLGFSFVGASLFNLSMCIEFAGRYYWQPHNVKSIVMPIMQNIGPSVALVSLLLFTFSFPISLRRDRRLRVVVPALFLLLNAVSLAGAVAVFLILRERADAFELQSLYFNILFLSIASQFTVIIFLMFRKVVVLGRKRWRQSVCAILKPRNRRAALARTIAVILALPAVIALLYFLSSSRILSPVAGTYLVWFGFQLFYSVFIVVYLNNTSERTTLQVKLVGIALTCILGIQCVAAIIAGRQFERDYRDDGWPESGSAVQLIRGAGAGYTAETARFSEIEPSGRCLDVVYGGFADIDLPFPFPFYSEVYRDIRVLSGPLVFLGNRIATDGWGGYRPNPAIAPIIMSMEPERGEGIFYEATDDRVDITWYRIPEQYDNAPNTVRLTLFQNGTIRFSYGEMRGDPRFRPASLGMSVETTASVTGSFATTPRLPRQSWLRGIHPGNRDAKLIPLRFSYDLPFAAAGPGVLFEAYDIRFFRYIHDRTVPLVLISIISAVLVLVCLPVIFRRSVTRPLTNLLEGMRRANAGEQEVHVTPSVNDEIGYITESFNRMLRSIRTAEEQARLQHHQLMQADRLASLGVMVAGMAHEINNPNQAILGFVSLLTEAFRDINNVLDEYCAGQGILVGGQDIETFKEKHPEYLRKIEECAWMISGIVKNLKSYVRDESDSPAENVNVNDIVLSSVDLCRPVIKQSTRNFVLNLSDGLPPVRISGQRLKQVIVNLLMNACQALLRREDGIVCSTLRSVPENTVTVTVKDEGVGISASDLSRVFTPLFTTKRESGGTGLGLAVCRTIVEENHGTISLESEAGCGTVARVTFPASAYE
ncbi:MAG: HAMP domain-containing protein [Spirochaetales bacterium]|nr:HAMP domain-containing protein [Spirochaetales bacterium]